jgi:hypothetical protein
MPEIWELRLADFMGRNFDRPARFDPSSLGPAGRLLDGQWARIQDQLAQGYTFKGLAQIRDTLERCRQNAGHELSGTGLVVLRDVDSHTSILGVVLSQAGEWVAAGQFHDRGLFIKEAFRSRGFSRVLIVEKFRALQNTAPNPDRPYSPQGYRAMVSAWRREVADAIEERQCVPAAVLKDYEAVIQKR